MREIAPDVRVVLNIAEFFGLEAPVFDLREQVDAETAEYIANQLPRYEAERDTMLAELLEPVVGSAVAASRAARDAWDEVARAEKKLGWARRMGHFRIEEFDNQVEMLTRRAAELMLAAHARAQEAEGVARAVGLARRGETWRPRDVHAEAAELFGFSIAAG